MEPTLRDGEVAWMRERSSGDAPLCPDDIVVLRYRNEILVKRIVATGGEAIRSIRLADGGSEILETHGPSAPWTRTMMEHIRRHPTSYHISELTVPDKCIYVVGDNEPSSWDSRDIGPLPEKSVLGVIAMPESDAHGHLAAAAQLNKVRVCATRPRSLSTASSHSVRFRGLVRMVSTYWPRRKSTPWRDDLRRLRPRFGPPNVAACAASNGDLV
jgi:signal peptidase I